MANINELIEEAYDNFVKKEYSTALEKISNCELELDQLNGSFTEVEIHHIHNSLRNLKGFNYLAMNKLDNALSEFEKTLEDNPASSQACAGLGEVYYLLNQDEEAKIMYEWAIANNPNNQFAHSELLKVNTLLGLPGDHNTLEIDTTLKKKKEFYSSLNEAYKLFAEKKHIQSLDKLNIAENIIGLGAQTEDSIKKHASIENFKGFNYLALNDIEAARECFENALNNNETSSQACAGLGEVFFMLGQDYAAKSMFEHALNLNTNNLFALSELKKVNRVLHMDSTHNSLLEDTDKSS